MPNLAKDKIVRAYLRLVEEHGRNIGEGVFHNTTGISPYYWKGGYWRSWSAFQVDVGVQPNKPTQKTPDETLLARYALLAQELGFLPKEPDLMIKRREDPSFPSKSTFRRWGSRNAMLQKVAEFCEDKDEFADVFEMLHEAKVTQAEIAVAGGAVKGFVYLIRSGNSYKIGRTNAVGRRLHELAIQLPQKPDTIHVIETDDPEGIEQYWHRRFAEKRKGGEWFSLTSEDIAAFKKRTFQ